MAKTITFNTSGLIAGTPLTGEDYYKFIWGAGSLAAFEDISTTIIYLTADNDGNPATFNLHGDLLDSSGNIQETVTGVVTFLDTNASKLGPESWSAELKNSAFSALLPDSNHDGWADGFVFPDSNQLINVPLTWHAKDAKNEMASFAVVVKDAQNNDITFSGSLLDTNNDNQPDRFTGQALEHIDFRISLIDSNGDSQKDQLEFYYNRTANGRVQVDSSGNPAGIYMDTSMPENTSCNPVTEATQVAIDSNIVLTFSEAIQKGEGSIVLRSGSATGTLVESFDMASSLNLIISGNTLTINPTNNLVNSTYYYVGLSRGAVLDVSENWSDYTHSTFTTTQPRLAPMTHNGVNVDPDVYTGPAKASEDQAIHFQLLGDTSNEVLKGTLNNDFINVDAGDDAIDAGAGNDVIDGGLGSNFLTGGAGSDIFFSDGRGGGITWSTITDWNAGEQLSVWGWTPGTSRILLWQQDGAEGYKGITMHADLNGDGTIDTSVTFTGLVQSDLPTPLDQFDNLLWFK